MPTKTSLGVTLAVAVVLGVVGAAAGYYLANGTPATLDAGTARPVVIAIQPTDNPSSIQANAGELEKFLEERSGLDVEIAIPLTYTGTVEALRFGHADVALMSAWPSRLAHDIAAAEIVLAEQREVIIDNESTVAPYYFSYYVVKPDNPAQRLQDLRGKGVAYPSLTSTSGYVYPLAKLVDLGLVHAGANGTAAEPKEFFGDVRFAGGYAQAWEALKMGQVDAAVVAGDIPAALFQEVIANTRIIETQGPVPSHAVVFSKDFVGTPRAEALKAAFLELQGDHKELMRKLVSGIFVAFAETTTQQHTAALDAALEKTGLRHQDKLG